MWETIFVRHAAPSRAVLAGSSLWTKAGAVRAAAAAMLLCMVPAGCGSDAPSESVAAGEAYSADGVKIAYDTRGEGDPALILVHGWANTRAIWGLHPETLSRAHRVVALDLAGHGVSGAERSDWTMEAFGDDVVAVIDQLGLERVVLVGFSMGGAVVLEAAKKLGDRVAGIVFVDEFHDPDEPISDEEVEQLVDVMRSNWRDPGFIRAFGFTPDAPDSLIAYVVDMMPEQPQEHLFAALESAIDWIGSDLAPALESVQAPLAAINTTVRPTNLEAWERYDPSFAVDTMQGVGHGGILLRRVDDFDRRLLAAVERFASDE